MWQNNYIILNHYPLKTLGFARDRKVTIYTEIQWAIIVSVTDPNFKILKVLIGRDGDSNHGLYVSDMSQSPNHSGCHSIEFSIWF